MNGEQLGFDKIESASRDELTTLQTQRLKSTLCHAYENTVFYRKKFDQHGVHQHK